MFGFASLDMPNMVMMLDFCSAERADIVSQRLLCSPWGFATDVDAT